LVRFELGDARALALKRGWNAWIAGNAPYGLRVGEEQDVVPLLRAFGARLRDVGQGSSLALLLGRDKHAKALGLRELRRMTLVNGGLECVLALGKV
jgi:23S rRNA (guanine2445-N2)-methyltransferase / 23S rRNA (guanine2069-N7)-methyltransferase